jgi:hypothetical protein
LAFIVVPFLNEPQIIVKINEFGDEVEEKKDPELHFLQ